MAEEIRYTSLFFFKFQNFLVMGIPFITKFRVVKILCRPIRQMRSTAPHLSTMQPELQVPAPQKVTEKKYYGFCHGHSYDLHKLNDYFRCKTRSRFSVVELPNDVRNILLVSLDLGAEKSPGLMFFFCRYGTCVCWDIPSVELDDLKRDHSWHLIVQKKYDWSLTKGESDSFAYIEKKGTETSFNDGTVFLNDSLCEDRQVMEKLAFSYALAQSVRLGVMENDFNRYFKTLRDYPDYFVGKTPLSYERWQMLAKVITHGDFHLLPKIFKTRQTLLRHEAAHKISGLLQRRYELVIDLGLWDEPDCFWDRDDLVRFYNDVRQNLDILRRLDNLKSKTDISLETAESLHGLMSGQYSDRLEQMIILLILVEVVQSAILIYNSQ